MSWGRESTDCSFTSSCIDIVFFFWSSCWGIQTLLFHSLSLHCCSSSSSTALPLPPLIQPLTIARPFIAHFKSQIWLNIIGETCVLLTIHQAAIIHAVFANGLTAFRAAFLDAFTCLLVYQSQTQLVCLYSQALAGVDMPAAKVFHQKLGWLKVEGKQIFFSIVGMSQPQVFWSIAWAHFYVEDNCHHIFFPANLISLKNTIFWEIELLYFTGLRPESFLFSPSFSLYTAPLYVW